MSFKPKVLTNFGRYKDGDLPAKAHYIITCMTGNTAFTTPIPTLTEVTAGVTAFEAALANAEDGGKTLNIIKDEARNTLETLLTNLSLYVQLTSNGNIVIMASSGFDVNQPPAVVGVLPKPGNFKVSSVNKGSAALSIDALYGAGSYQFEFTDAPVAATSVWTVTASTAASITITTLTSGKEYAFRVTGVGSDPTRIYSDVITAFIS